MFRQSEEWRTIEGFEKGLAGLDFPKQDSYFPISIWFVFRRSCPLRHREE